MQYTYNTISHYTDTPNELFRYNKTPNRTYIERQISNYDCRRNYSMLYMQYIGKITIFTAWCANLLLRMIFHSMWISFLKIT